MPNLEAAHRGYEYQDLLTACRLVDLLLGVVVEVNVDKKSVIGDRFDDLTTVHADGSRERVQFKHTDNDDRPLTAASFTNDSRSLHLGRLFAAMLTERDGSGNGFFQQLFRVVLRDTRPTDPRLTSVLRPAIEDPGPFLPAFQTERLVFDAEALWAQMERQRNGAPGSGDDLFGFLVDEVVSLSYEDLVWLCDRLVIEVAGPAATRDLTSPGAAEELLLARMREDVGAESFPNENRTAADVAEAFIGLARFARQGSLVVTSEEILRRAQLRTDFGSVARAHPVDRSVEVLRPTAAQQVIASASVLAKSGGTLLAVGPPGQGKSWLCQQVLESLSELDWLVAEHYCFLGDADNERTERVLAERVFGSLVHRLGVADPRLTEEQRPLLAADEDTLVRCIARSLEHEPERRVAIVVDGIDHVTRVQAGSVGGFDPSLSLAEAFGSLDLPPGSVFIVLSQPGVHLRPLEEAGAETVQVEGFDKSEIRLLAERLGMLPGGEVTVGTSTIEDDEIEEFLEALADRSSGNALYATYLCREVLRRETTLGDPAATIRRLPPFDGTLENYYQHLYTTLGSEGGWVADLVSLVDFAVTRHELCSIRPDAAHRVDGALDVLKPVLVERAAQGGVRVYHESFARYLRRSFQNDRVAYVALVGHITDWLEKQGIFEDTRAFRSLIPLLAEAGHDNEAIAIVDRDFVVRSIAAGFPVSAVTRNLATAIRCAARINDWSLVARYVEMSRAAQLFQNERFAFNLVEFADVQIALLGPSTVAERLLHDGHMTMSARDGLQMCAAVDAQGAVAPWQQYITGFFRKSGSDHSSYGEESEYGEESDPAVLLALLRGGLRLARIGSTVEAESRGFVGWRRPEFDVTCGSGERNDSRQLLDAVTSVDWRRVADWVKENRLYASNVVAVIVDIYGVDGVRSLMQHLDQPGAMCLALAEHLAEHVDDDDGESVRKWASKAVAHGVAPGTLHAVLSLDASILNEIDLPTAGLRDRLFELTRKVQERSIAWGKNYDLEAWFDACTVAAYRDPLSLDAVEARIIGEGWYKCWLRFTIGLARAEATDLKDRSDIAVEAFSHLQADLRPFSGEPRACDLHSIQPLVTETIGRAVTLVDDERWPDIIRLLDEVSSSITTTFRGAIGGPLPPGFVIRIAVDGSNRERQAVALELLTEQFESLSAGRYYADLGEFYLLWARLSIASENHDDALKHWHTACTMLTAYGWHKDITIFELLEPLPTLIEADRRNGQKRVALVQPLCERIPFHTDFKETRAAWVQWWMLVGLVDPAACSQLAARTLLHKCNRPNWVVHGALEDLWRSWCERADPVLAGALRFTLDMPLDTLDAAALSRLAVHMESETTDVADLMTWLLARADERPTSYSYSNNDELVERDDARVAALNSVAETANLPNIDAARQDSNPPSERSQPGSHRSRSINGRAQSHDDPLSFLPPGPAGLAQAIRLWRKFLYKTTQSQWTIDRFANVFGYRILELVETGRERDAESALRSIAEVSGFDEGSELLRVLAAGLERHEQTRLATIAYALVWTRTRGRGGWVSFAGEKEISSLRRATELDSTFALEVVAEETGRAVATGQNGTYGICDALIHAFAVGVLTVPTSQPIDTAFALWDEAFEVISERAPQVHESEVPDEPYIPADRAEQMVSQHDLDFAFALAVFASLAHPGRERKRRSLLAVKLLMSERPDLTATAFDVALSVLTDPATIVWLLRLVELNDEENEPILAACKQTLAGLATGPHLVVRALARRLLGSDAPPLPPSSANAALLSEPNERIWTPPGSEEPESDEPPEIDELVQSVAGNRLSSAEPLLPGLSTAVRVRAVSAVKDDRCQSLYSAQIDAFGDRFNQRYPDAFLMVEQTIEETLQLAAAGGRAALFAKGEAVRNPVTWESDLADVLLDDPTVPLAVETRRIPRPPIPAPPLCGNAVWAKTSGSVPAAAGGGSGEHSLEPADPLCVTLQVQPPTAAGVVKSGRFRGWRMIATVERRTSRHEERVEASEYYVERRRVLEVRDPDDCENLERAPVAVGDIRMWWTQVDSSSTQVFSDRTTPLFGVDVPGRGAGYGLWGSIVQLPLLTPTPALIAVLGLHPGDRFTLDDAQGCGLALITWRSAYEDGESHLARPGLVGSAVIIRPDLCERLEATVGNRLVLRDFRSHKRNPPRSNRGGF